ncbi:uncharacterized protein LOC142340829 [Convolutriloba macropyga]|uniref:uncharacterized protein LOC142340829 n=1 Tax=Convolutriloba macropyga TaxID=536237 RepID=UPI003F51CC44
MPALFDSSSNNANTFINFEPLHIDVGSVAKARHPSDNSSSCSSGCFSLLESTDQQLSLNLGSSTCGSSAQGKTLSSVSGSSNFEKYWADSGFGSVNEFKALHNF